MIINTLIKILFKLYIEKNKGRPSLLEYCHCKFKSVLKQWSKYRLVKTIHSKFVKYNIHSVFSKDIQSL